MPRVPTAFCALALASLIVGLPPDGRAEEHLTVYTSFAEFGEPVYGDGFEHFDYVNPVAPKGGRIRLSAFGTYERLDTIRLGGRWVAGIGLTSDSLMTGSADELASYYPAIAESVAVPDDLSYAIFAINPAARFHDGHPITAEDFVFAFEHMKDNGRPLLKQFFQDVTAITALSERVIRYDLATTGSWKTVGLAASLWPAPVHFWEESGRDINESYLEPALGWGEYRIVDVDPGRSITYERVEDYWAADLPAKRGQANFDRITYVYFRDEDVMFEAFLGGEYDFRSENSSRRWATGYDAAPVESDYILRTTIPDLMPRGFVGMVLNLRRERFQDIRVREALGYLFDFEWTRENVMYGSYQRARSYFTNSDYGVADFPLPEGPELAFLEPFRDQLPEQVFTTPFVPPRTDGSGRIRSQLRSALGLLREAGWEIRDSVLINVATGEPMEIEILMRSNALERVIQPFVNNLKRAGIDASMRIVDTAQYERRTDDFDYDVVYLAANFFPPPGAEQRTYFASDMADEQGSANWPGIVNPVVDALLDEVVNAGDLETLKAANRALDRVLLWNHYIIPTYYNDNFRIAYWAKFDRPEQLPRYGTGFPGTWWYAPHMAAALPAGRR
ncbi:MAG: extracellular solute-binding protein [Alphaproteobacteria bacterium]